MAGTTRLLPLALVLAATLAASAPLSGCLACHPHLDVRWCRPGSELCGPGEDDRVHDWNPELASVFPDLARLLDEVPLGKHRHTEWTPDQERAFWQFWDVAPESKDKEVFLRHEGNLFRVRVLACG